MEYYVTTEKNKILPFVATWMELEVIMFKLEKKIQMSLLCPHFWILKGQSHRRIKWNSGN
jgi:hypothetical protein